nr:phenylalanine--tRNA ligase, chloroplastic/mitochondrial-like [Ipomoea batatas]
MLKKIFLTVNQYLSSQQRTALCGAQLAMASHLLHLFFVSTRTLSLFSARNGGSLKRYNKAPSIATSGGHPSASVLKLVPQSEKWMEVLGCGVTEQEILKRGGRTDNVAWAFGLGLERLAMVLFDIPDIRLFWSADERFTSQFSSGQLGVKFKPFSKVLLNIVSSVLQRHEFSGSVIHSPRTIFVEVVRGIAGDLVEEVCYINVRYF